MRSLKCTSLLSTRLSDFVDGMKAQITIELLALRSAFLALHRGNCIKNIILIIRHHPAFWSMYTFALYSIVKVVLFKTIFRCFSIENILDIWNFKFLGALVRFLGVLRYNFLSPLSWIRSFDALVIFEAGHLLHLWSICYRVLLTLNLGLHHNWTLTHGAFEVAIRKSALVFVLVLIDGLSIGAVNAAVTFLIILLWELRENFSCTILRVLRANLDIIARLIQNHSFILEIWLWSRAFGLGQVLLSV